MVHYTGFLPVFHIKNKLEFYLHGHIAFSAAKYRPHFTVYQLWRSVSHRLIKIETLNFSYTHICSCVIDPNKIYLCSNMFYC